MNVLFRDPRRMRLLVAATFVGLLFPAVISPIRAADAGPAAGGARGPELTVPDKAHDFGRVAQGQLLEHSFTLRNTGATVLEITEVKPSCGCTTTGDWPHTLPPGQAGALPIKVDTAHFAGPILKTVSILSNDPAHPELTLELRANVWTPISVINPVLIFPAAGSPDQAMTRSTTIRSETEAPLTLTDLRVDNPRFRTELKPVIPGKEYELVVTTVPPLPEGTQAGRITLATSSQEMPQLTIQAIVTVLPAVQVAPSQIMLGGKLAAPEKRYAVIHGNRTHDLAISDVSTDAPGVALITTPSPEHDQVTITLTFPAGFEIQPGARYSLWGKTNQAALPTFEIPIVENANR